MKILRKNIVLLGAILILLVVAIFFVGRNINQAGTSRALGTKPFWANQTVNQDQPVNKQKYQEDLKEIITYLMANLDKPEIVKASQEKILTRVVPAEYRQLHLDLVIVLTHLEQTEQFEQGKEELERILAKEEWLLIK